MPITLDSSLDEDKEIENNTLVAPNLVPQTSLLGSNPTPPQAEQMPTSVPQEDPEVTMDPEATPEEPTVTLDPTVAPEEEEEPYIAEENQAAFNSLFGLDEDTQGAEDSIYAEGFQPEENWQTKMEDEQFLKAVYDGSYMTDGADRNDARFLAHKIPAGILGTADIATFLLPTLIHNTVDFVTETGAAPYELLWNMIDGDMSFEEAVKDASPATGFTPEWFGFSVEELYMQNVAQVKPETALASYAGNAFGALASVVTAASAMRKLGKSTNIIDSDLPQFLKDDIIKMTDNPAYFLAREGMAAITSSLSSEAVMDWYLSDESAKPEYAPVVAILAAFGGGAVGYRGTDKLRPAFNRTAQGLKVVTTASRASWNMGRKFFGKLGDNELLGDTVNTVKKTHVGAVLKGIDRFINKRKPILDEAGKPILDVEGNATFEVDIEVPMDTKLSTDMTKSNSSTGLFADEIFDKLQKSGVQLEDLLSDKSRFSWLEENSPLKFGDDISWINYAKTPHQQKFALMLAEIQGDVHVEKTFARLTKIDGIIKSKMSTATPLEKRALVLAAEENYKVKQEALTELYGGVDSLTNITILDTLNAPESRTVVGAMIKEKFEYFRKNIKQVNDALFDIDPENSVVYTMDMKRGSSAEMNQFFKFEVPDKIAKEVYSSLNVAQSRSILDMYKGADIKVKVGDVLVDITEVASSIAKGETSYAITNIPIKYRQTTYTHLDTVVKDLKSEQRDLKSSNNDPERLKYLTKAVSGMEDFLTEGLKEFPELLKKRTAAKEWYKTAYLPIFGEMSVGGDTLKTAARNTTVGKVAADQVGAMIWGGPESDTNIRRLATLSNESTPGINMFDEMQGLGDILSEDILEQLPGIDTVYATSKDAHMSLMLGVTNHIQQEIAKTIVKASDPRAALSQWKFDNSSKLQFFPEILSEVDNLIKDTSSIFSSPDVQKALKDVRVAELDQTTKIMKQLMDTDDLDASFSKILKSDISSLSLKEWLDTFQPDQIPVIKKQAVSSIFQKAFNSENPEAFLDTGELLKSFQAHKKGLKVLLGKDEFENMQGFMEQVEFSNNVPDTKVITDFDSMHPSSKMLTVIRELPSLFTSLRQREVMGINRTYLALLHAGKIAAKRVASMSDDQVEELTYLMSKLLSDKAFASETFAARSQFTKAHTKMEKEAAALNLNRTWLQAGVTTSAGVSEEEGGLGYDQEWVADVNAIEEALVEGRSRGIDDQQIIDRVTKKLAQKGLPESVVDRVKASSKPSASVIKFLETNPDATEEELEVFING